MVGDGEPDMGDDTPSPIDLCAPPLRRRPLEPRDDVPLEEPVAEKLYLLPVEGRRERPPAPAPAPSKRGRVRPLP